MKKYKLGVFLGRFQHFHLGHKHIVDSALEQCESLLVMVGSAQEAGTRRNPFEFLTRADAINRVYDNNKNVVVAPIEDLTHENDITFDWGRFVLERIEIYREMFDLPPFEAMFYGNDEERNGWFDPDDVKGVDMIAITRGETVEISATELRKMIIEGDYQYWKKYTHESTHSMFWEFQSQLRNNPYYDGRM